VPFASKAQHRKFRAMEAAGELPKGTSSTWAHHTKDMKALPEHKESAVARDFAPLNDGGTAEKHPNMPVPADEVSKGIPVEKEHTTSTTKARAIAVDHVVEIPDYYKRLEKLEDEAKEDGVKRADRLLRQLEALPGQHEEELAAATDAANSALTRQRVIGEIGAGVGGALSSIPGVGLLLPSHNDFRNDARAALEAEAEEHAQNLGELQAQHAEQATQLLGQLRARAGKVAFDLTQTSTEMGAAPRGDELHLPMGLNPYMGDPKAAPEYENGFDYAQALGHQMLNQATEGDVQRWVSAAPAWREGFADACSKLGLSRVGDAVLNTKKEAGVPSALEPAGHWSRGAGAVLGAGTGIAAHSLWGDPGELYTLVPAALGGVAAGTVAGDLAHSVSQQSDVPSGAPIRGTDDPRVRTPQAPSALAGLGLGAGLGYLGGHYAVPESWHDTSGGHVPEIVGTSVGGVGGAMAGSALEDRLSGRGKRAHYTLLSTEDHMTRIAPMTDDSSKTANAMIPLLGALGGAAGGAMIGPHVSQLGDFISQHHQGADPTVGAAPGTLDSPNTAADEATMHHAPLSPEELTHLQKLYGAGIGGGLGLAGGLTYNAMNSSEPRQPGMYRTADAKVAEFTDIDSDVEGSAIAVLEAKVAALGTTLGTLAGISGGALAGNYLAPAMHWAVMPGEHAALGNVAQHQIVDPAMAQVDPHAAPADQAAAAELLKQHMQQLQNPEYVHGLQAGAEGTRGAEWGNTADLGRVLGAGVGGVAGYQAGRGIDEAFGLEKRERPLVISPMAPRPGF